MIERQKFQVRETVFWRDCVSLLRVSGVRIDEANGHLIFDLVYADYPSPEKFCSYAEDLRPEVRQRHTTKRCLKVVGGYA